LKLEIWGGKAYNNYRISNKALVSTSEKHKENKMRKIGFASIPMILMVFVLVSACGARAVEGDPVAPDFMLEGLNGTTISLSDFEGKVLFMNFWATWCPPCRAEIPDFIEAYDEYKDMGLAILGVSVDNISPQKVNEFVKRNEMNYPVAMATKKLFQDYPAPAAIPTTLVIDGTGKIRYRKVGLMSKRELIDLYTKFK
jgi:cytochrome c biogenesis protein CcmG/thiol:disulfide interchange protein DsbE